MHVCHLKHTSIPASRLLRRRRGPAATTAGSAAPEWRVSSRRLETQLRRCCGVWPRAPPGRVQARCTVSTFPVVRLQSSEGGWGPAVTVLLAGSEGLHVSKNQHLET